MGENPIGNNFLFKLLFLVINHGNIKVGKYLQGHHGASYTWHKSLPLFHEPLGANSKPRDGVRRQNSSRASYRGEGQTMPWGVAAFLFFSTRNFGRALRFRLHFLYLAITGERDTLQMDVER